MSLRDELMAIRAEYGKLTPAVVVTAAADPEHSLHSQFEWDDSEAGRQFREVQAAQLIRSVKIKYAETRDGQAKSVRAFVAPRLDTAPNEYIPVEQAVDDPFTKQLLLRQLERELRQLRARYAHLREFAALVQQHALDQSA